MAYRTGNRDLVMLLPDCIDDFVPADAPVRAYDAMIGAMDLSTLGIEWSPVKTGCPQYDPKAVMAQKAIVVINGERQTVIDLDNW